MNNHADVVKLLLDLGADVNFQKLNGGTALFAAAQSGHLGVAHLLLGAGAEVELSR